MAKDIQRITLRLPEGLFNTLKEASGKKPHMSMNTLIAEAIIKYLAEEPCK